jgi:hypothetical protein
MENYATANQNQRLLAQKIDKFKIQFEADLIENSKKTAGSIMKLNEAKDMNEV